MDINIGKYEFGKENKVGNWVDMRTKLNPNAPYGVDKSIYPSKLSKDFDIKNKDYEKVWNDIVKLNKLDNKYPIDTTIKQYHGYVRPFLNGFVLLYKFCPEGYNLLMNNDFKIHFITSNWEKVYQKSFPNKSGKNSGGFWDHEENPPGIYINLRPQKDDITLTRWFVFHELLHALGNFCGKYYAENPCCFFKNNAYHKDQAENIYYLSSFIQKNHKITLNNEKYPLLSLLWYEYNQRGKIFQQAVKKNNGIVTEKLIKEYGVWGYFEGYGNHFPTIEEYFTSALVLYFHPEAKKILKKLDLGVYRLIEKVAIPLIKEANIGLTRKKLYKPQRGERAEYH